MYLGISVFFLNAMLKFLSFCKKKRAFAMRKFTKTHALTKIINIVFIIINSYRKQNAEFFESFVCVILSLSIVTRRRS